MTAFEEAIRRVCQQLGSNPHWCITLDESGVEPDLAEAIRTHIGPIVGATPDPEWAARRKLELQATIDVAQRELELLGNS